MGSGAIFGRIEGMIHAVRLLTLRNRHYLLQNRIGWRLYAGLQTGTLGTRRARERPTHSHHKAK